MKLTSILRLAWKNLWSHRLRALLTIGGVTIGIGAIVFLVSIAYGLEQLVTNQVVNFDAYSIVDVPSANLKTGKINEEAIGRIRDVAHVKSISQIVDLAGRIKSIDQNSTMETIVAAVEPSYFKMNQITVNDGEQFDGASSNQVVINRSLLKVLGYTNMDSLGGKKLALDLIIPRDLRTPDASDGPLVKSVDELTVIGVIEDDENPLVYIPLSLADKYGVINRTSLKLRMDNPKSYDQVKEAINNLGFSTEYVGDTVKQIEQVFTLFRLILGGFGLIALVVAALGTFNTLTISLMERVKEVGLLKILGVKRNEIFKLFIVESIAIGAMGGIFGILLSILIGQGLNLFLRYMAERAGAEPVAIYLCTPSLMVTVAIGSLVVGFFTGFYPAYRAIKTKPLDALRYE